MDVLAAPASEKRLLGSLSCSAGAGSAVALCSLHACSMSEFQKNYSWESRPCPACHVLCSQQDPHTETIVAPHRAGLPVRPSLSPALRSASRRALRADSLSAGFTGVGSAGLLVSSGGTAGWLTDACSHGTLLSTCQIRCSCNSAVLLACEGESVSDSSSSSSFSWLCTSWANLLTLDLMLPATLDKLLRRPTQLMPTVPDVAASVSCQAICCPVCTLHMLITD